MRKTFILLVLSVFVLFPVLNACSVEAGSESGLPEEVPVEPIETIDISDIETVPMGEYVDVGDVTWNVMEAQDKGTSIVSSDFVFESVVGKIIIIEFTVENMATESRILYDLSLVDNQGRVYSICLPAYRAVSIERACALQEIIPGIEYVFEAPFDVGADAEGLILKVTDLKIPPDDTAYIDLGT